MKKILTSLLFSILLSISPLWAQTGGAPAHTQPSVTTATSFTCRAANPYSKGVLIENNTAANIMINLACGTLTGIVPTSTNKGIVLSAGASYSDPTNYPTTGCITCYQTSGSTVNTISVVDYS